MKQSFKLFFVLLSSIFSVKSFGQLVVSSNLTAQQLVQKFVGTNVATLNPALNCTGNHNGSFTAVGTNLGLPGGIILATGTASSIANNVSFFMGQEAATAGDAQLTALVSPYITNDACVLEFDFVPDIDTASTMSFDYVFGSEEYPEYACTQFNDVFAFFLSGPGYNPPINIALVPNTPIPVAINSINNGTPGTAGGQMSICNGMGAGSPFPQYYVDNQAQNGQTICLDGFTTALQAKAIVYPCDTYHMKLAIANVSDHAFQSAVFLKENSFTIDTIKFDLSGIISSDSGYLVEGCTPATINITRNVATPNKKKICLSYGGTAINGTDYPMLPDSLVIQPGATFASMILNPIQDNINEPGFETVVIRRLDCCTLKPIDSIEIKIRDSLKMTLISKDVLICGQDSVKLHVTGDPSFSYSWTPTSNVLNPNDTLTWAFPNTTTTYTVKATFQGCPEVKRSFTAFVEPIPQVHIMNDTALCIKDPLLIKVDVQPSSFPNYSYQWSPATYLSSATVKQPTFSIASGSVGNFSYILTVKTPIGCTGKDTFTITAKPGVKLTDVTSDFTAKYGDTAQLHASGAPIYVWTPDRLLNYPNTADPTAHAIDTATFQVIGLNIWGCADTAYVKMNIDYTMFEILPSAFSPNGDGRNDVFQITNMKYQRLIEFRIFNRWGQEIFSTTDHTIGWDGTYKGTPQDVGVYQYLIRVTTPQGIARTYKGNVTLIR